MTIVNSTYTLAGVQADGRVAVDEQHTDHLGRVYRRSYFVAVGSDYATNLAQYATELWTQLIRQEILEALEVDATPTLQYATKSDFIPVYRAAYRIAAADVCAKLATWLLNRMDDGWVTDAQVQAGFGLTAGQWTTLKGKMTTLRTHWLAILAAMGE